MIKCPFCHFENEDGALFCERCTSDLTAVAPAPALAKAAPPPAAIPAAVPMAEALPIAEAAPFTAEPYIAEAVPFTAEPYVAEAVHAEPLAHQPAIPSPAAPPPEHPPVATLAEGGSPAGVAGEATPATPPQAQTAPAAPPGAGPAAAAAAASPAGAAAAPTGFLPPGAQPRLLVLRGQKRNVEYPIFEGANFLGRADEKPVDIDLEEQEPPDRVWCSRQHACIHWEDNQLQIEDLNSANGTYVNRTRVYPGQKRPLSANDIVQIGNVQLKVVV